MPFLALSFNQDNTCLAVGLETNRFRIYNCDPFGEVFDLARAPAILPPALLDANAGATGFLALEMLYLTLLVVMVDAQLHGKRLTIANFTTQRVICTLRFTHAVTLVRLNRNRLVVWLALDQVYIYDIARLKLLKVLEYAGNGSGSGIGDLLGDSSVLVLPHALVDPAAGAPPKSVFTVYDATNFQTLAVVENPHKLPVAQIAVLKSGRWVATASARGTIIRVFDTGAPGPVYEFRRGHLTLRIQQLQFGRKRFAGQPEPEHENILLVSSDSNTIHVFRLEASDVPEETGTDEDTSSVGLHLVQSLHRLLQEEEEEPAPVASKWNALWKHTKSTVGKYASPLSPLYHQFNDWYEPTRGFAAIHLPHPAARTKVVGADGSTNQVVVCGSDGWFYVYDIGDGGEQCRLVRSHYVD